MPVKQKIHEKDGVFFITFTCYDWIPLIHLTSGYDLFYQWFDWLKSKGHYICGFVIMPNHIHALIAFRNTNQSIAVIIGNGKRFIAYEIIRRLNAANNQEMLGRLWHGVIASEIDRNKKHQVWRSSFDWKECMTDRMINTKLDYMHDNPCTGIWNLAGSPFEYVHSSARFYICAEHANYPVTHFQELEDIDLTK